MRTEKDKSHFDWLSRNLVWVLFAIVVAAALLAGAAVLVFRAYIGGEIVSSDISQWGQTGDFFGGILNPIFGFLTIVALVLTLLLQSKELKMSREELEMSRAELAKSAEALKGQNRAIDRQNFEQTFFSWLNTYSEILQSVEDSFVPNRLHNSTSLPNERITRGRRALQRWWGQRLVPRAFGDTIRNLTPDKFKVESGVEQMLRSLDPGQYGLISKQALEWWEELFAEFEFQLDNLFRVLYRLIIWIDSQDDERVSPAQKWLYVSIIRARLSSIELVFLFYNGHTLKGQNFKRLIEKYALFDNLNSGSDPVIWLVRACPPDGVGYKPTAYASVAAREAIGLPASGEETLALASDI